MEKSEEGNSMVYSSTQVVQRGLEMSEENCLPVVRGDWG